MAKKGGKKKPVKSVAVLQNKQKAKTSFKGGFMPRSKRPY